jgi:hypothetical protein
MNDQPTIERRFGSDCTLQEVFDWVDQALEANQDLKPRGIRVSNRIYQMGVPDTHAGLKIAMDPKLYPDDEAAIAFE